MVRVTIELVPHGLEARKQHLGTIEIANDATGTPARGNYYARLSKRGRPGEVWKTGTVGNFPRKRLGAYDLLFRVLRGVVGERNQEAQP